MGGDKCFNAGSDDHPTRVKTTESTVLGMNSPDIDKIRYGIAGVSIASAEAGHSKSTQESAYVAPSALPPPIAPPVQTAPPSDLTGSNSGTGSAVQQPVDISNSDESIEDSDDDSSDEYDSDVSDESFETRKKSDWFRAFFETLDRLPIEQITKSTRIWHCPACKGGPRAIVWYKGLQPLMTHSKTKGSKRGKLHWDFAELLEEELQRKGVSVVTPGELFGKWKGLQEDTIDHEIVWPPIVLIMNTLLEQDENEKWLGMGNQELLNYFNAYEPIKARHSYGPRGHRGMSVLIFEASAVGYLKAELLHKHFAVQGTDRDAWEHGSMFFCPGGKRQLYGFMATKKDMDTFNKHSRRKACLKFEMTSYQKMVMGQIKKMKEDGRQLLLLKYKIAQQYRCRSLEESSRVKNQVSEGTKGEIVKERTMTQCEQSKKELQCLKERITEVHKATEAREFFVEQFLQEEDMVKPANKNSPAKEDHRLRMEEAAGLINFEFKGVEEFETAREQLIHAHEQKKSALRCWYLAEEAELEKSFGTELNKLREKYAPDILQSNQ